MLLKCPVCGTEFEGKGAAKYCSRRCYAKARLLREYPKTEKECPVCKQIFIPTKKADQKYCSPKCRSHADYLKRKDIILAANNKWRAENLDHVREQRRKQYWDNPEKYRQEAKEWRDNNPERFRETRDRIRDEERFSGNRAKAIERDGYKCVKCGSAEMLNVHHKDRSGGKAKPNNSLDNLITLCTVCHGLEHGEEAASRNKCEMVKVVCERCGKPFEITPSRYANGRGKYCSRACRWPKKK